LTDKYYWVYFLVLV